MEGWTTTVFCPHGKAFRASLLDIMRFNLEFNDDCPEARVERAREPQELTRAERRAFRRIQKQLKRGA